MRCRLSMEELAFLLNGDKKNISGRQFGRPDQETGHGHCQEIGPDDHADQKKDDGEYSP